MADYHIQEEKIERAIELVERICRTAWQNDLATVEALVERLRVVLIVEHLPRRKKAVYRALIDYMEDVLERRFEETEDDRETVRRHVLRYIAELMKGLKP